MLGLATVALIGATLCQVASARGIHVRTARIGCLDIQHSPNLTPLVRRACEGHDTCNYKAPNPRQYQGAGVHAATRTFCSQAMEITYDCGTSQVKRITVPGDAWDQPPAALMCASRQVTRPTMAPTRDGRLRGFVDLHAHPMSNLAFGGKLVHGGPDIGSLLPVDPHCRHRVRATSEAQALGPDRATHGGWNALDNPCGDSIREAVISNMESGLGGVSQPTNAYGYPTFTNWPKWNDLTHQKMWVDWIHRAYQGGLRVMVALTVNNELLAHMTAGPGDGPIDDKASSDLQLREIKRFVARHSDFMQIAYSAADVHRIVAANKLAVVLGMEIDHIGNLHDAQHPTFAQYHAEIQRLHGEGVRYIFPVHLVDNPIGGSAAYVNLFNVANVMESGHRYDLVCADPSDHIAYRYSNEDLSDATNAVQLAKLGKYVDHIKLPNCPIGAGEKNNRPLTTLGQQVLVDMMRQGMLIDIDHMDQRTTDQALALAQRYYYPVNSGHNGLRGVSLGNDDYVSSERQLTAAQYRIIGGLHGMAGVGSAKLDARQWLQLYKRVIAAMGGGGIDGGFGTDFNGLEFGMPPRRGSHVVYTRDFPASRSGTHTWDYNRDGVAHYGMLWDFLQDVRTLPGGADMVDKHFMYGADYFYQTWKIVEARAAAIRSGHGTTPPVYRLKHPLPLRTIPHLRRVQIH